MMTQQVILVSPTDKPIGSMEKMEAHQKGLLHRAFSVFIFDAGGSMLLQQRAATKYHGGLLWTNACCSHPYLNEAVEEAARRRLFEELGFETTLEKAFVFTYKAAVENDLIEHEIDHVFIGEYEGTITPNADEVNTYRYVSMKELKAELEASPEKFTTWFRIAFDKIESYWHRKYKSAKEMEKLSKKLI